MSMITKPIILDETGRKIASILEGIRDAISTKSVDVPNMPGVKFIDYDGTVVYFAGRDEVLHMKKLPDAPVHVDLTTQGWNWSLADIKAYMTKYHDAVMTVGQMYIPSDGKTHMILDVGPRLTIPLMIQQTVSEGITINWGDGSEEETIEGTGTVTTSHAYESEGEYEITFDVADGCTLDFGGTVDDTACNVFGESQTQRYIPTLKQVYIGNGVISIGQNAFNNCYALTNLTIPNSVTSIEYKAFSNCTDLTSLTIPHGVTSIGQRAFGYCYTLTSLTIPNSVTSIESNTFIYCVVLVSLTIPNSVASIEKQAVSFCYALTSLTIPDSVTSIGQSAFVDCFSLTSLTIPDGVTSIGQSAFKDSCKLINLTIPDSVTSIGSQAFSYCFPLYTLTVLAETPPTLANVNAFESMPTDCTIYVPHGKGDVYKAASGWSTWASQIQELPE